MLVGCDNLFNLFYDEALPVEEGTLPCLSAVISQDVVDESDIHVSWVDGDAISVFYGSTLNSKYRYDSGKTRMAIGGGMFKHTGEDMFELASTLDGIYSVAPYYSETVISNDGKITCTLPTVQKYVNTTVATSSNTMVAFSPDIEEPSLEFKNVCGYLKVNLYGGVSIKSVEVRGNNSEKISGTATISISEDNEPSVSMHSRLSSDSIILDCGEGIKLGTVDNPTECCFAIPPTIFTKGVKIIVTGTNGAAFVKSLSESVIVTRNKCNLIDPIGVEFVDELLVDGTSARIPDNEIWYTTTDKELMIIKNPDSFDAEIISHKYKLNKAVIEFDRPVTKIGDDAFYASRFTSITLPPSLMTIGKNVFSYGKMLRVVIPDSVIEIGDNAFSDCKNLLTVQMGRGITKIGNGAFSSCESLVGVTLGSNLETIGADSFKYCLSLGSITIPEKVKSIGRSAFHGCSRLSIVYLPDSVEEMGEFIFGSCGDLNSIKIPKGLKTIPRYMCNGCVSLSYITIPPTVKSIEWGAFSSCESLRQVTIPASVSRIAECAFIDCISLKSVVCESSIPPAGGGSMFDRNSSKRKIYVPDGSGVEYKSASYWNKYKDDIVDKANLDDENIDEGDSDYDSGTPGWSLGDGAVIK